MDLMDIYDDLDEFHEKEEKKSKEFLALEVKYNEATKTIEALLAEKKELQKKIRIMELNLRSLLDTAKAEIKRKDKTITELRTEKDDICFRRRKVGETTDDTQQSDVDFKRHKVKEERETVLEVFQQTEGTVPSMRMGLENIRNIDNIKIKEKRNYFKDLRNEESSKKSSVSSERGKSTESSRSRSKEECEYNISNQHQRTYSKEIRHKEAGRFIRTSNDVYMSNKDERNYLAGNRRDYTDDARKYTKRNDKESQNSKGKLQRSRTREMSNDEERYSNGYTAGLSQRTEQHSKEGKGSEDKFHHQQRSKRGRSREILNDEERCLKDYVDGFSKGLEQYEKEIKISEDKFHSRQRLQRSRRHEILDDELISKDYKAGSIKRTEHHQKERENSEDKFHHQQRSERSRSYEISHDEERYSKGYAVSSRKRTGQFEKEIKSLEDRRLYRQRAKRSRSLEQAHDKEHVPNHRHYSADFRRNTARADKEEQKSEHKQHHHKHSHRSKLQEGTKVKAECEDKGKRHHASHDEHYRKNSSRRSRSRVRFEHKSKDRKKPKSCDSTANLKMSKDKSRDRKRHRSKDNRDQSREKILLTDDAHNKNEQISNRKAREISCSSTESLKETQHRKHHQSKIYDVCDENNHRSACDIEVSFNTKAELDLENIGSSEDEEFVSKVESKEPAVIPKPTTGPSQTVETATTAADKKVNINNETTVSASNCKDTFTNKSAEFEANLDETIIPELPSDENSNFPKTHAILDTPKKIALFDALFGDSPKQNGQQTNKPGDLLANVKEILDRCGGNSVTTSLDAYTDMSNESSTTLMTTTLIGCNNKDDGDCTDAFVASLPMRVVNISDQVCFSPSSVISISSSVATQDANLKIIESPERLKLVNNELLKCLGERKTKEVCLAEGRDNVRDSDLGQQEVGNLTSNINAAAASKTNANPVVNATIVIDDDSLTSLIDDVTASIIADVNTSNQTKAASLTAANLVGTDAQCNISTTKITDKRQPLKNSENLNTTSVHVIENLKNLTSATSHAPPFNYRYNHKHTASDAQATNTSIDYEQLIAPMVMDKIKTAENATTDMVDLEVLKTSEKKKRYVAKVVKIAKELLPSTTLHKHDTTTKGSKTMLTDSAPVINNNTTIETADCLPAAKAVQTKQKSSLDAKDEVIEWPVVQANEVVTDKPKALNDITSTIATTPTTFNEVSNVSVRNEPQAVKKIGTNIKTSVVNITPPNDSTTPANEAVIVDFTDQKVRTKIPTTGLRDVITVQKKSQAVESLASSIFKKVALAATAEINDTTTSTTAIATTTTDIALTTAKDAAYRDHKISNESLQIANSDITATKQAVLANEAVIIELTNEKDTLAAPTKALTAGSLKDSIFLQEKLQSVGNMTNSDIKKGALAAPAVLKGSATSFTATTATEATFTTLKGAARGKHKRSNESIQIANRDFTASKTSVPATEAVTSESKNRTVEKEALVAPDKEFTASNLKVATLIQERPQAVENLTISDIKKVVLAAPAELFDSIASIQATTTDNLIFSTTSKAAACPKHKRSNESLQTANSDNITFKQAESANEAVIIELTNEKFTLVAPTTMLAESSLKDATLVQENSQVTENETYATPAQAVISDTIVSIAATDSNVAGGSKQKSSQALKKSTNSVIKTVSANQAMIINSTTVIDDIDRNKESVIAVVTTSTKNLVCDSIKPIVAQRTVHSSKEVVSDESQAVVMDSTLKTYKDKKSIVATTAKEEFLKSCLKTKNKSNESAETICNDNSAQNKQAVTIDTLTTDIPTTSLEAAVFEQHEFQAAKNLLYQDLVKVPNQPDVLTNEADFKVVLPLKAPTATTAAVTVYHSSSDESSSDIMPLAQLQQKEKIKIIENIRLPALYKVKQTSLKLRSNDSKVDNKTKRNQAAHVNEETKPKRVKVNEANSFKKNSKAMITAKIDVIKPYSSIEQDLLANKTSVDLNMIAAADDLQPTTQKRAKSKTLPVQQLSFDDVNTSSTPQDLQQPSTSKAIVKKKSNSQKNTSNNSKTKTPQKSYIKIDAKNTRTKGRKRLAVESVDEETIKPKVKRVRRSKTDNNASATNAPASNVSANVPVSDDPAINVFAANVSAINAPAVNVPVTNIPASNVPASNVSNAKQTNFKKAKLNDSDEFKAMLTAETSPLPLPAVSQSTFNDANFADIDKSMQAIFESPLKLADQTTANNNAPNENITIDETVIEQNTSANTSAQQREVELAVSTILVNDNNNSIINASLEGKHNSSCENSFESSKRVSLGASEYLIERVSENVVTMFVTRKRRKKPKDSQQQ